MDFIYTLLYPLEWVVAWLMVSFHQLFTSIGLPERSGFTWALSIVGLVIVIRIVLIPLFVKQIHAQRRMQLIQPEMQKIQKEYKGKTDPESRQAMTQETMSLYKRTGTNPFSSCLPILLQSPVFFALFTVLQSLPKIANTKQEPIGPMTQELASSAEQSTIFGAQISDYFLNANGNVNIQVVTVVLIVLMSVTQFVSTHQLMMKNMPANALDNPYAKQQKIMLYVMPLVFAGSGINFPVGVLLYWLTTYLWSMGQQFYTIRRMPVPGSPADKALEARRLKSGKEHKKFSIPGLSDDGDTEDVQDGPVIEAKPTSGQRLQPKRNKRTRPVEQGAESAGTRPPGAKPRSTKPKGVKPAGSKPQGVTPSSATPSSAKPPSTKPPSTKSPGAKPPAVKPSPNADGDS